MFMVLMVSWVLYIFTCKFITLYTLNMYSFSHVSHNSIKLFGGYFFFLVVVAKIQLGLLVLGPVIKPLQT